MINDLFKNNNHPNKSGETCSSTTPATSYTATEVQVEATAQSRMVIRKLTMKQTN